MDQPLYLLLGAGTLIVIIALLMRRPPYTELNVQPIQTQMDRAEMEKSLQRFVQQIKHENEAIVADLKRTKAELSGEVAFLRQRLEKSELEVAKLSKQLASFETERTKLQSKQSEIEASAEDQDMLALRERYRRVFELKQDGLSIDEIAKRLGAGQGEIELIFSLAAPYERGHADA